MKLSEEMKATIKKYDDYTDLGEMTQYLRTRASALEVILPKVIELEKENDELYEALKDSNSMIRIFIEYLDDQKVKVLNELYSKNKSILQKKGGNNE